MSSLCKWEKTWLDDFFTTLWATLAKMAFLYSLQNEALALTFSDLEDNYKKAGRQAELRYSPPDTTKLILQCRG